jgi:Ser/Thr protein kinase RdoA (MazF antagonist)
LSAALTTIDDVAAMASDLLGWRVLSATLVRRGGNNRIFLLDGSGQRAVLKFYPPQSEDPRDRLGQEFAALSFLRRHGIEDVPRPLARDSERGCAVYEWIEGAPLDRVDVADVDQLADFFIRLQQLRDLAGAQSLAAASAACFSPAMVTEQIGQRLARLHEVVASGTEVAEFVAASLAPAADAATARLRAACEAEGLVYAAPLPRHLHALSPSDFGSHNALRRPDGRLAFVDFEYFGWDDPAKAIADVMLHPGMMLPPGLAQRYRSRVEKALRPVDDGLSFRVDLLFPSMVLLWCLILLTEVLPERRSRRAIAGRTDGRAAELDQLQKARDLFSRSFA